MMGFWLKGLWIFWEERSSTSDAVAGEGAVCRANKSRHALSVLRYIELLACSDHSWKVYNSTSQHVHLLFYVRKWLVSTVFLSLCQVGYWPIQASTRHVLRNRA